MLSYSPLSSGGLEIFCHASKPTKSKLLLFHVRILHSSYLFGNHPFSFLVLLLLPAEIGQDGCLLFLS